MDYRGCIRDRYGLATVATLGREMEGLKSLH
jgi:hypothetical protein